VDNGVQESSKVGSSVAIIGLEKKAPDNQDGRMVVDVEER